MKCPHCAAAVSFDFDGPSAWLNNSTDPRQGGYQIAYDHCPECGRLVVILARGDVTALESDYTVEYRVGSGRMDEVIYPKQVARLVEPEVPEVLRAEFAEACSVLASSPRASAALSRRILQFVLRDHFGIPASGLSKEIEALLRLQGLPSYMADAIDTARALANFSAHPEKDSAPSEIVAVEAGEAEWFLEVIEALFDFAYVQPTRLAARKQTLNEKLAGLGKPPVTA